MSIFPTKEDFIELTKRGNLIPIFKEILADQETPVSAYERVRTALRRMGAGSHTYLLESVEGGENIGRYSFIGGQPRAIIRAYGREVEVVHADGRTEKFSDSDPLDVLKNFMTRFTPVHHSPELPPFTGGAVGFLGYDNICIYEPSVKMNATDTLGAPDMVFMVTDAIIVFDRVKHRLKIMANAFVDGDPLAAYDAAASQIQILKQALQEPVKRCLIPTNKPVEKLEPRSNIEPEHFAEMVEQVKEYIRAGDLIQCVISQRFEVDNDCDSLDAYRALRAVNPSPYMFLLDMNGSAMVGSSPEIHVRCENRQIELRPIAGTRPRHSDPAEDKRLEVELLADPKECAEHIMLVDLGRNDVGRVSEYGSVKVPELMVIERYSHVMHIVSDVTGTLAGEYDSYDLLRASFPAGTVSGAPKVRAMQIISDLEPTKRGPYAGLVGYIDFDGNLDSCITIRTIVLDKDKAYVQAGAGIVADSDPVSEYEETRNKARGMIRALAIAKQFKRAREEA